MAVRPEVSSAWKSAVCVGRVELHLFVCVSSMSANSLRCHFGQEGIRPDDVD